MPQELAVEYKWVPDTLIATTRCNPMDRAEVQIVLNRIRQQIPEGQIAGPAFCILNFVTSIKEGLDAEVGFPVRGLVENGEVRTRTMPGMQVLALTHKGPTEDLGKSYGKLYGYAAEHGLISDEFCREVYQEWNAEGESEVELQFVIHDWNGLLAEHVGQVLGEEAKQRIMLGSDELTVESAVDQRFRWVKGAMEKLEGLADDGERYDILSRCAHVFPASQIEKLSAVYQKARAQTDDAMEAVDAVIDFMGDDPGWGERPRRDGRIIYSFKNPRDRAGYEKAETDLERKKAYCFCPLVREHLEDGMPTTFCYCGSGWYRQQWEGATGKPVTIEIVSSILMGDDRCEFAIRLADDL